MIYCFHHKKHYLNDIDVLLLTNDFTDAGIYTVDGEEYSAVTVTPGQYVDKGGEVNITAISNKTGNKTVMNYVIGANALVQRVELSQPAEVVADDESATIPYVAYDKDGNTIKNFESIARSTNTLSLTASDGKLEVKEDNDGTAKFVWTDKTVNYTDSIAKDGVDRSVALTTVVVGGDSQNFLLSVSDKAYPAAVKSVSLGSDRSTVLVEADSDALTLSGFAFVDQYGRDIDNTKTLTFFSTFKVGGTSDYNGYYYGVKAEYNKVGSNFTITTSGAINTVSSENAVVLSDSTATINWTAKTSGDIKAETVKYSVVNVDKNITTPTADDYSYANKPLNVSYTIIPVTSVSNISIKKLNKQYVDTGLGTYATAAEAGFNAQNLVTTLGAVGGNVNVQAVDPAHEQTIKTLGSYKGVSVLVPSAYIKLSTDKFVLSGSAISAVSEDAVTLGELYDAKAANLARKDAIGNVKATVYTTVGCVTQFAIGTLAVTYSDAAPVMTKVSAPETATVCASNTNVNTNTLTKICANNSLPATLDQYEVSVTPTRWVFTVSDITENTNELAHLDNSLVVKTNSTNTTNLEGAEIGDTLTLTFIAYDASGNSASASSKITLGADTYALISSDAGVVNNDKVLRATLKYAY